MKTTIGRTGTTCPAPAMCAPYGGCSEQEVTPGYWETLQAAMRSLPRLPETPEHGDTEPYV